MARVDPKRLDGVRGSTVTVAEAATEPVSAEGDLSVEGTRSFRLLIEVTAVGGTGGTLKLQHKLGETEGSWTDLVGAAVSTAAPSAAYYTLHKAIWRVADQADMPVSSRIRVVAVTTAGNSVTVGKVWLQQG